MHFNSDFKYDLKLGQLGEKHLSKILKEIEDLEPYVELAAPG